MVTTCGVNLNAMTLVLSLLIRCLPANDLTEIELDKTAEVFGDIIMSGSKHHYNHNYEDSNAYDTEDENEKSFGNFDKEEDYGHTDYGKYHKKGGSDHFDSGKEFEKESRETDDYFDEISSSEGEKHDTKHQEAQGKKESDQGGMKMYDDLNKSTGYRKVVHKVESDEHVEFHDDSDGGKYEKYDKDTRDKQKEVKKYNYNAQNVEKHKSRDKLQSDHGKSGHGERKHNYGEVKKLDGDHKVLKHESSKKEGHDNTNNKELEFGTRLNVKKIGKPKSKEVASKGTSENNSKSEASKVSIKSVRKPNVRSKQTKDSAPKLAVPKRKKSKLGSKDSRKTAKLQDIRSKGSNKLSIRKSKHPKTKSKNSSDIKSTATAKTEVTSPQRRKTTAENFNNPESSKTTTWNQVKNTNDEILSKSNARSKVVKMFWPKNVQDIILGAVTPKKESKVEENPQQTIQLDTMVTKQDDKFGFSDEFQDFVKSLETFD